MTPDPLQCLTCGAVVIGGTRFCGQCGRRYQEIDAPFVTPWRVASAVACALILFLAACGFGAFISLRGRTIPAAPSQASGPPALQSQPPVVVPPSPPVDYSAFQTGPTASPRPSQGVQPVSPPQGSLQSPQAQAFNQTGPLAPAIQPFQAPSAPPQRAENDRPAFDKYLRWLQSVERERAALIRRTEALALEGVQDYFDSPFRRTDDGPSAENQREDAALMERNGARLQQSIRAAQLFREGVVKSRQPLRVPFDCQALDTAYFDALNQDAETSAQILQATAAGNLGLVQSLTKSGGDALRVKLGLATAELERACKGRGIDQPFTIWAGRR